LKDCTVYLLRRQKPLGLLSSYSLSIPWLPRPRRRRRGCLRLAPAACCFFRWQLLGVRKFRAHPVFNRRRSRLTSLVTALNSPRELSVCSFNFARLCHSASVKRMSRTSPFHGSSSSPSTQGIVHWRSMSREGIEMTVELTTSMFCQFHAASFLSPEVFGVNRRMVACPNVGTSRYLESQMLIGYRVYQKWTYWRSSSVSALELYDARI
jgi:hypothetical protein